MILTLTFLPALYAWSFRAGASTAPGSDEQGDIGATEVPASVEAPSRLWAAE